MIPGGIMWILMGIFFLVVILGGIKYKFNTIEKAYAQCIAENNTKQICFKL